MSSTVARKFFHSSAKLGKAARRCSANAFFTSTASGESQLRPGRDSSRSTRCGPSRAALRSSAAPGISAGASGQTRLSFPRRSDIAASHSARTFGSLVCCLRTQTSAYSPASVRIGRSSGFAPAITRASMRRPGPSGSVLPPETSVARSIDIATRRFSMLARPVAARNVSSFALAKRKRSTADIRSHASPASARIAFESNAGGFSMSCAIFERVTPVAFRRKESAIFSALPARASSRPPGSALLVFTWTAASSVSEIWAKILAPCCVLGSNCGQTRRSSSVRSSGRSSGQGFMP